MYTLDLPLGTLNMSLEGTLYPSLMETQGLTSILDTLDLLQLQVDMQDLSLVDTQDLSLVDTQDLSQVDTQDLSLVDTQDLSQVDTQDLSLVDIQDLTNLGYIKGLHLNPLTSTLEEKDSFIIEVNKM